MRSIAGRVNIFAMKRPPKADHPWPEGWADDGLSAFLQMARENQFGTFFKKPTVFAMLHDIDNCFQRIADYLGNPPDILAALLLIRSHSAYRAAAGTGIAGQEPETFVLLRSCLEYAAYGLFINKNPQLAETWIRRHDNALSLKAVRDAFKAKTIAQTVGSVDRKLGDIYSNLYDNAISFGAHPNERGLSGSTRLEKTAGESKFLQIYLENDDVFISHGLNAIAQVGLCSLYIFQHVFTERFEILGLRESLQELRGRISTIAWIGP